MSEAICTEGDDEAEAVREPSAFGSGPASAPVSNPGPDATPLVAAEAIAGGGKARPKLQKGQKKRGAFLSGGQLGCLICKMQAGGGELEVARAASASVGERK